jgi:hypothetical protein
MTESWQRSFNFAEVIIRAVVRLLIGLPMRGWLLWTAGTPRELWLRLAKVKSWVLEPLSLSHIRSSVFTLGFDRKRSWEAVIAVTLPARFCGTYHLLQHPVLCIGLLQWTLRRLEKLLHPLVWEYSRKSKLLCRLTRASVSRHRRMGKHTLV